MVVMTLSSTKMLCPWHLWTTDIHPIISSWLKETKIWYIFKQPRGSDPESTAIFLDVRSQVLEVSWHSKFLRKFMNFTSAMNVNLYLKYAKEEKVKRIILSDKKSFHIPSIKSWALPVLNKASTLNNEESILWSLIALVWHLETVVAWFVLRTIISSTSLFLWVVCK